MLRAEYQLDTESFTHREDLKRFYNTEIGVKELSSLILIGGLLSDITNPDQLVAHNICVRKLEEIGLLDEEGLEPLVKYLLTREPTKYPVEGETSARDGN